MTSSSVAIALLGITLIAAFTDLRTGLIPNWLTLPVLVLTPPLQLVLGGASALLGSVLGALSCALIPLCLFRAGAMGGGDVKLLTGLGALAGPMMGLELQLLAYNLLVSFALVALARRGQLGAVLKRTWRLLALRSTPSSTIEPEAQATFRLGAPLFCATALHVALTVAP
jgi:Flp pilus assembly protein protease CpaA